MKVLSYQSLFDIPLPPQTKVPFVESTPAPLVPQAKTKARAEAVKQRVGFLASTLAPWYEVQYETWPKPPRRQSMIGDDGIESPFVPTVSVWGFDALPPDLRKVMRRLPAIGDDGIEGSFNLFPWGYDLQPLTVRVKMKRDPQRGDDGNEAPFVFYVNSGWEIAPAITYNAKRQKSGAIARGNDGEEGGLINLGNFGFEVQPTQPLHRRFNNLDDGDRGIENAFTVAASTWGFEATLPSPAYRVPSNRGAAVRLRIGFLASTLAPWSESNFEMWRRPPRRPSLVGDDGTESPFVPAVTSVWGYEAPAFMPRLKLRAVGLMRAEALELPVISLAAWGWEIQSPQPPYMRFERWAGLLGRNEFAWFTYTPWFEVHSQALRTKPFRVHLRGGEDILSPLAAPPSFAPLDFNPPMIPLVNATRMRAGALGQRIGFLAFPALTPMGWEIQAPQPPHPTRMRWAALARGDDGTENTSAVVAFNPQFDQAWQPPHPRRERAGTLFGGDTGTELPFIVAGFNPYFDQDFHARLRRKPVPQQWAWNVDTGLLNLAIFTEVQSVQPPRRPWERRGAFLRGDDGIEGTEPVPVPPFGWFIQPWQPPRRKWEKWAGIAPRDDQAYFPLLNLRVFTEVQPPQPPHRPPPKVGSFLRGDDQAYYPLINLRPMGWEVQPPQPPFEPRTRQKGAILKGDDGITFPFVRFFPMGWEFNFPTLLHRWWHDPETGDPGTYDLYRPGAHPQWGFEWPYPPLLVRRWHRANIFQGFDSSIFPYAVIGPDWCLAMDFAEFSCAASDIAVPTLASDVGTAIVVGDI